MIICLIPGLNQWAIVFDLGSFEKPRLAQISIFLPLVRGTQEAVHLEAMDSPMHPSVNSQLM
jgi:hypothetical protein